MRVRTARIILVGNLLVAQVAQAVITGTVRDQETNDPISGAVVVLTDLGVVAATDTLGRYAFQQVPAGPQHLSIKSIGYAPRTLHALMPREGKLTINVSLSPDPIRIRTIEVRAPILVRGLEGLDGGDDTPLPDRTISLSAIRNHPMLPEPDAFQALGGGEVVLQPETPSGVHVRGGAADHTAYLLDDIPVFNPRHSAGLFSAWNPDALSRMELSSSAPSSASPAALSGTVTGLTQTPGRRLRGQGGISTTQARVTLDGPLGLTDIGYLVSVRKGIPGLLFSKRETTNVKGESGDWLAKIEAPAFGGSLRLLGYGSDDELDAAAAADSAAGPNEPPPRNTFAWRSRSLGVQWSRRVSGGTVRILGWSSKGLADAGWMAHPGRLDLNSSRRDEGVLAFLERSKNRTTTVAGVRVERSTTAYRVKPDSSIDASYGLRSRTLLATPFVQHTRPIGGRKNLNIGTSLTVARGEAYFAPRAQIRWQPFGPLDVTFSAARLYQFVQSLRNAESVVGTIFPVDLFMGIGAGGVPVARSDQGVVALIYRPLSGVRLGVQGYARSLDRLLLVARREGGPFATGPVDVGPGTSRGVSIDAAVSAARFGALASYGLQHVRFSDDESAYVPEHGATHLIEAGLVAFPTVTSSIRLGASSAMGRRTTALRGGLEWEACNLLDRGCEFSGSPDYGGEPLAGTRLPAYVRLDLGLRRHWHVELAGRDVTIALFGTFTNFLGRRNVLTYTRDPDTGRLATIEMRPRAPLVVGLDWRS